MADVRPKSDLVTKVSQSHLGAWPCDVSCVSFFPRWPHSNRKDSSGDPNGLSRALQTLQLSSPFLPTFIRLVLKSHCKTETETAQSVFTKESGILFNTALALKSKSIHRTECVCFLCLLSSNWHRGVRNSSTGHSSAAVEVPLWQLRRNSSHPCLPVHSHHIFGPSCYKQKCSCSCFGADWRQPGTVFPLCNRDDEAVVLPTQLAPYLFQNLSNNMQAPGEQTHFVLCG